MIEMVRSVKVVEADGYETPDYAYGYLAGQNDILDNVVELLESQLTLDEAESENRTCHLRAINAHLEHQLTLDSPIQILDTGKWSLS